MNEVNVKVYDGGVILAVVIADNSANARALLGEACSTLNTIDGFTASTGSSTVATTAASAAAAAPVVSPVSVGGTAAPTDASAGAAS